MKERQSGGGWLAGLVVGAAIGAVTGLLVAPRTGRQTRIFLRESAEALPEILPEMAEDFSDVAQTQADRLSEVALQKWDDILLRLKDAIAAGVEAGIDASRRSNPSPESRLEPQDDE